MRIIFNGKILLQKIKENQTTKMFGLLYIDQPTKSQKPLNLGKNYQQISLKYKS